MRDPADIVKRLEEARRSIAHFLLGCAGHVEHERDTAGVWWIGLRCDHCGRMKGRSLSAYQDHPALFRALAQSPAGKERT